jgi:hypothetical protein
MPMVVPKTKQRPETKGVPDIPLQYLAMAAATMHQQGKFDQPDQPPAQDGPATS